MNLKNFKIDLSNKNKDLIPQVLTILFIVLIVVYFTINAQNNMGNRGISFGFGFLSQESSFDIQFSLIDYDGSHSYARAFLVGLLNTILVSVIGIFFATILGVTIGISRLSQNYLISKVAEWYVEIFRNIPLILQIFLATVPLFKKAWVRNTYEGTIGDFTAPIWPIKLIILLGCVLLMVQIFLFIMKKVLVFLHKEGTKNESI